MATDLEWDRTGRSIVNDHGQLEYRFGPGATCEIVNIEVNEDHRQQGTGRSMLEALFGECKQRGIGSVYAISRADNMPAQEFYEKTLFRYSGVLRRFYNPKGKGVDAVIYARSPEGPV